MLVEAVVSCESDLETLRVLSESVRVYFEVVRMFIDAVKVL